MSMLPFFFRDMARPLRMIENQMRRSEDIFRSAFATPIFHPNYQNQDTGVVHGKEKTEFKIDLANFRPEDIKIKIISDGLVEIQAKHEEKDKGGFISREIVRRFVLPQGHDFKKIASTISPEGILTIVAPRLEPLEAEPEKIIPITYEEAKSIPEKKSE